MDGSLGFGTSDVVCVAAMSELRLVLSLALGNTILAGYDQDNFCFLMRKLKPLRDNCIEEDGLFFIDGQLVVPNAGNTRQQLIDKTHVCHGNLGYTKTIKELRQDFFWPLMAKDALQTTKECEICQKIKSPIKALW